MVGKQYSMTFQIDGKTSSGFSGAFKSATAQLAATEKEIAALNRAQSDIQAYEKQQGAVAATEKKLAALQQQYDNVQREIKETEGFSSSLENKLISKGLQVDKTTASLDGHNAKLKEMGGALDKAGIDAADLGAESTRLEAEIQKLSEEFDKTGESANSFGSDASAAFNMLGAAMMATGVVAGLKKITEFFRQTVNAAVEFESAMTGVSKTTDMTEVELAAMSAEIKNLSTEIPIAATELAAVAEVAGQLGVAKNDLLDFSVVMAMLETATTMTADEAATLLAQMTSITRMDPAFYSNLGSSVVALGNNYSTTEQKIISMGQGIASSASLANMSEADIMGMSAAVTSLGFESQMGATAISKLITEIQLAVESGEGLEDWAAVAGMSAEEFANAWGSDATGALEAFITGLGDTEASGGSLVVTLQELGITETRMANVIKALATSEGRLSSALKTSNTAWAENTALVNEAEKRYATTESKFKKLENAATNLQASIGGKLTPALGNMAEAGTDVLAFLDGFISESEIVVPVVAGATIGLAALSVGVAAYTVKTQIATAVQTAFNGAMLANPAGIVIASIAGLAGIVGGLAIALGDAQSEVYELTVAAQGLDEAFAASNATYAETESSISGASAAAEPYINYLAKIEQESILAGAATDEYALTIDKIRTLLPEANIQIDESTGLVIGNAEAVRKLSDEWKNFAVEQALAEKYEEQMTAWGNAAAEVAVNQHELNVAVDESAALLSRQNEIVSRQKEITEEINSVYDDTSLSYDQQIKKANALATESDGLVTELWEVSKAFRENKKDQENLNEAIAIGAKETAQYEEEVETGRAALKEFTDEQVAAAEATEEETAALAEQNEELQTVAEKWGVSAESIQASIENSGISLDAWTSKAEETYSRQESMLESYTVASTDMFGRISGESSTSLQEMIDNLSYNAEAVSSWSDNIALLAEQGIDDGLLQTLIEAGPESAAAVQTIVDGGADKIAELSRVYSEGGQAAIDAYKEVLAVDPENQAALQFLQGEADAVTGDTSLLGALEATGAGVSEYASVTDEKLAEANGKWDQAKAKQTEVAGAIKTTLSEMESAFSTSMSNIVATLDQAIVAMNKQAEAAASGRNTVQGFINGAMSMLPQVSAAYQRVAMAAMSALDRKLDINSPSKEMEWRAEMSMAGFINQTEAMQPQIAAVMAETSEIGMEAFAAQDTTISFAPELMSTLSSFAAASRPAVETVRSGAASGGGQIVINLSPTYNIGNVKDADGVSEVLADHDEITKDYILEVLREAGIDAGRVSYI